MQSIINYLRIKHGLVPGRVRSVSKRSKLFILFVFEKCFKNSIFPCALTHLSFQWNAVGVQIGVGSLPLSIELKVSLFIHFFVCLFLASISRFFINFKFNESLY